MIPSLIFPRENYFDRGDLRRVQRIIKGRVFNPTTPTLSIAAWVNTEAAVPGYRWVEFTCETAGFVTVDWGDGTQPELVGPTGSHNLDHVYTNPGKYLISISYSPGNGFIWTGALNTAILDRQIMKIYVDRQPPAQPPTGLFD